MTLFASQRRSTVIHPADARRFRAGGMFGAPRWYKDGDDPPDWRTGLPDDLKASPALKDVKDVAGLAKRFVDTQAHLGNSIRIPGENAGEPDRAEFREKLKRAAPELVHLPKDEAQRQVALREILGVPKEPKGYEAPKDVTLPESVLEALRAEAAEEGLSPAQFASRAKRAAGAVQAQADARKQREKALSSKFGLALDDTIAKALAAAEKTGAPKMIRDALEAKDVDEGTLAYFAGLAKALGAEPREVGDHHRDGQRVTLTPSQASAEEAEILRNPALFNPGLNSQEHERLKRRLIEIQPFIHPELAKAQED